MSQHQTGNEKKKMIKKREKKKKKKQQPPTPLLLTPTLTLYHRDLSIVDQNLYASIKQKKWDNQPCLICGETFLDEKMWNNIPGKGTLIEAVWRRAVQQLNSCPHDDDKIWQMAIAKIEGAISEKIREIKNNSSEPIELDWDEEPAINFLKPEEFHEHYQILEKHLAQLNTQLCDHCLILCDFQYCNECDLIYNPPPRIIYTIPEEKEPISSCTSELE
ncbi:hypothetical protein G9A89_010777 [Geosiphon pyriformis]|nr:hypothetical protein G9A89_010777 [Geosiphon pyriformis]